MASSIYGIAVSGLNAAQVGMSVTGHNIANASTAGYNRQTITQSAFEPEPTGSGFVGRGVQVTSITRVYNEFLARQVQTAKSQDGYLSNLQSHIADLDNLLADPTAGLSPSLQDFFRGVQTVANNPQDTTARQSLLGLSESMITKLKTVNERMTTLRNDVNTEIRSSVASINSITSQIAKLNEQINLAKGSSDGQAPNDLLDRRDQLVKDLNGYVKSTVIKQTDGSYNIFIGNGQNLVVGTQSFTLGAVQAPDDPSRLDVAYQQFGSTTVIPSNLITGGSLGGVLEFRTDVLDEAQSSLGRVAAALAQTVNAQHRRGQDLNGQFGGNFFQIPVEQTSAQYRIGANSRTLTAELTSDQPFIESDFNVAFDGTNYTITRLTDGQTATATPAAIQSAGGQVAFGVRFRLDGDLAAGEDFGVSFLPAASHVLKNANNKGDGELQVSIKDSNQLATSDYEFIYDGPDYRVVRKEDGTTFNINASTWNTPPVVIDGLQFRLNSGTMQPGDRYTIQPTRDFADNMSVMIKDTAKVAAAAPIRTSSDTASIAVSKTPTSAGTIAAVTGVINAQGGAAAKKIELVFTSASTYDVIDSTTGNTVASGQSLVGGQATYNGWTVSIAGAASGDRYVVDPRRNTGSATISAGTVTSSPVDIDLKDPVSLVFTSPTTFELRDPATGNVLQAAQPYTAGGDISFNGWTVKVSGVPSPGDGFLVEPNAGGKADARNMLAMGELQTKNTLAGGTASYQGAYSKLVADVGVRANQVNINQEAQAQLLQQAETKLSESSGVNLDEEAANLLIFQQAYLASSRTIQIAQRAFEEVLTIGR
ncbi:flagellar hook-associated protein FlgK [Chitinimonas koreensis]|uniref:flagellar hook-associated protein FlgK n=1 Tax=Chitinimonas koreensis TaxID=356302 RepID=UPI00041D09CD|nr:flagellar hook-associated protein FlgK [Chitinimonas koreensis]QNM98471.1 flagellar hook-associated protein FlgK [Chitinimonas koreensis]